MDDRDDKQKPVSLEKKRREKAAKAAKAKKISISLLAEMVKTTVCGDGQAFPIPWRDRHMAAFNENEGFYLVKVSAEDIFERERIEDFARKIYNFLSCQRIEEFTVTASQATEIAKTAFLGLPQINDSAIDIVQFANQSGPAWKRLPFRFDEPPGDMPRYEGILSRMSDPDAFCDFIGSLFFRQSYRQQYMWVYGQGGDGKGSISEALGQVLGSGFMISLPTTGYDNTHWTTSLLGKRLVVFDDTNAVKFPASGTFKMLTGGNRITVNPKYQQPFEATLNCKFIFMSNERPQISSSKADQRRAILIEVAKRTNQDFDPHFMRDLIAETPGFIRHCYQFYADNYKDHSMIKQKANLAVDLGYENDEPMQAIFDRLFVIEDGAAIQSSLPASEFQNALAEEFGHNKRERDAFLSWMRRTMPDNFSKFFKVGGKSVRIYPGIKRRLD